MPWPQIQSHSEFSQFLGFGIAMYGPFSERSLSPITAKKENPPADHSQFGENKLIQQGTLMFHEIHALEAVTATITTDL